MAEMLHWWTVLGCQKSFRGEHPPVGGVDNSLHWLQQDDKLQTSTQIQLQKQLQLVVLSQCATLTLRYVITSATSPNSENQNHEQVDNDSSRCRKPDDGIAKKMNLSLLCHVNVEHKAITSIISHANYQYF